MTLTSEQVSVFNRLKNIRGFDSVDFLRQCERYKDKPASFLYTRVKKNARKFALRELNHSNGICGKLKDRTYNELPRVCFNPSEYRETRYLSPEEYALVCVEYGSIENALVRITPPPVHTRQGEYRKKRCSSRNSLAQYRHCSAKEK